MKGYLVKVRDGIWRGTLDLPREQGEPRRQRRFTVEAATEREAQRAWNKILVDASSGKITVSTKSTLEGYLSTWLDYKEASGLAGKTIQTWRGLAKAHLIPYLGSKRLEKITAADVRVLHTTLLTSGHRKREGGLAPRSVLHCHRLLSEVLKCAARERLIASNPAELVPPPRIVKTERPIPDEAKLSRLVAAAEGTWLRLPILLAAGAALREAEVVGLRWSAVDLTEGLLTVREQAEKLTGKALSYRQPKRGKTRRLTLPGFLVDELRSHKGQQMLQKSDYPECWENTDLVITQENGSPRTPDNLSHAFAKLAERAGLPEVTFHDLRHCCATLQIAAGVPLKVVSQRLGHSSIAITADLYGHVLPTMDQDAASRTDTALRRVLGG